MPRKTNRSGFGSVRRLPSGRYQARYPDADGMPMTAPTTYATKADAEAHIATVRADRARGTYLDPRRGERRLGDFAADWIANGGSRGQLAARTRDLYVDLLARHIDPTLGSKSLNAITPEIVRSWRTGLRRDLAARAATTTKSGAKRVASGEARTRQAYALLRSIMATAEADGLIGRNPCQIRGAGVAKSPERPYLSLDDFARLVEAHPEYLRPALDLTLASALRLGELIGLQRRDLDLEGGRLTIERQVVADGAEPSPTKSGARRVVDLPEVVVDELRQYLATLPKALPGTRLFVRPDGSDFSRAQVTQAWRKARATVGLPGVHFHDIRHTRLTFATQHGASTAEVMRLGGHSTAAAAMVYQHAAADRGPVLAASLDAALRNRSA